METNRTEAEQQSLMENMADSVETLSADIEQLAKSIESQLQEYDTFTILGALTLQNHVTNPDSYKEYSHPGKSFVSEYATLLALKNPYSDGTEFLSILPVLHKLQEEIERIFMSTCWLEAGKYARRKINVGKVLEEPTTLDQLRAWMHTHELSVRNPAYECHHHEVLKGLFQPFEKELLLRIGFSIDDALALSRSISNRIGRLFSERLQKASEAKKNTKKIMRKAKRTGALPIDETELQGEVILSTRQYYSELLRYSAEEVDRFLTSATLAWLFTGAGDICSFTVDDLAKESAVSCERISAFLSSMSVTFGCFSEFDSIPSPTHPLRERPFVHHDGRYLASAPMLIDWALQPAFETSLKNSDGPVWQRYHKHRHEYVLSRCVDILQEMMPSASIGKNLLYFSKGDKSSEAEIDAIAVYDSAVFLVEVKGADITAPARRGAPDRLRRDLKEVIAKSHAQALRAKDYITRDREAIFRKSDGGPDFIVPYSMRDVVMVSISLATLGHLTALLHADSDIGLFKDGEYSWVVSLYDLIVIGDIIELPPMFPHYVKRRVHVARQGVLEAHDELDLFGYYLKEGLYLDDIAEEMEKESGNKLKMGLLSYTGQFDEYYSYLYGSRRKRAEKPTQQLPYKIKKMIERLENSRLPGRVEAATAILDLCHKTRLSFLKGIEKIQKISLRERRISDVSVHGEENGGWGLTYMCHRDSPTLAGSLRLHCNRKIEQMNYKKWLGFSETVNGNPKVVSICVVEK